MIGLWDIGLDIDIGLREMPGHCNITEGSLIMPYMLFIQRSCYFNMSITVNIILYLILFVFYHEQAM